MPHRLIHRTWSVRTLSPFAFPLRLGGSYASPYASSPSITNDDIAANTSLEEKPRSSSTDAAAARPKPIQYRSYPTLADLADALTDRLRACPDLVGSISSASSVLQSSSSAAAVDGLSKEEAEQNARDKREVDLGGTYVALTWIVLEEEEMDNEERNGGRRMESKQDSRKESAEQRGKKRGRGGANTKTGPTMQQRHLHLDIHVREESVGQILLCAASYDTHPSSASPGGSSEQIIPSFGYLLLRGKLKACRPILHYLQSTFGCVVGSEPFLPGPADIAASLTSWMVAVGRRERRWKQRKRQQHPSHSIERVEEDRELHEHVMRKPLELTLGMPTHLAGNGLDRIVVTVPPVALARLCKAMERNRPEGGGDNGRGTPQMLTDSEASSWATTGGVGATPKKRKRVKIAASPSEGGSAVKSAESPDQANSDVPTHDLPVLKALQCYLLEAFRIDARHLLVVKAATGHAVIGTDGRIKPLTVEALPSLLADLGRMLKRSSGMFRK